jgi:heme exporter protein B
MLSMWISMLQRDLMLAMRRPQDVLTSLIFFVIVVSLFPLGVSPEKEVLSGIAPGVIWVAALLASMLSLTRLFSADFQDGTLEQMLIAPQPLSLLVLSKVFAHWLLSGLPLVLMSPLLGMTLFLEADAIKMMMLTLLLGTPVLSLVGAIGASLTLGVRGGGVLLSLLILPLYVPILIFGTDAINAVIIGMETDAQLALLSAFLVLAVFFAPWASAAALRIMID